MVGWQVLKTWRWLILATAVGAGTIPAGGRAQQPAQDDRPVQSKPKAKAPTKTGKAAAKPEPPGAADSGRGKASGVPVAPAVATATPRAAAEEAPSSEAPASAPERPAGPLAPEAELFAKLDSLVAPVRDLSPSPEDLQLLKEVFAKGAAVPPQARELKSKIADPAVRKLADWHILRSGIGEPSQFVGFVEANPAWPDRVELIRRAEEQLLSQGGSSSRIAAFFKGGEPRTGAGWAALASAHLAEQDPDLARKLAAKVWREFELPATLETGFLERFGALLTEADHRRRLDRILVDEVRFSAERTVRAELAKRVIALLPDAERKKGEARLAVFLRAKLAGQLLAALPAEEGSADWGLAYQKVQHFRRNNQLDEVWKILLSAPTDPELITSPDDWWVERRGAAYEALKAGKPELAYNLVKEAGPLSANPMKDQTFMAGWLALRYLKMPEAALAHFEASQKAADGPLSKARAEYWLGRTLEALGRGETGRQRYAAAAMHADTFHGLLSRLKLEPGAAIDIRAGLPALPSQADAERFAAQDIVRAAVVASKAGLSPSVARALFASARNYFDSEADLVMLAHLAAALGDPQTSLRIGKTGIAKGRNLVVHAYPLHAFPEYAPLREPPEPALLLGIARQESEFNNGITSTAGARGLMQVMPITAKHICRDYKITCDIPRLGTDNAYNAKIASAYIGDRMAEFGGSTVLTLAGYNAGPGRTRQWMREFGDPRDPGIDPIDWIERIPIEETRDYVKKVLSNLQVYRARLGEERALRLEADLVSHRPSGSRGAR